MERDDYILRLTDKHLRHEWHGADDVYEGQLPICPYPNCPRGFPGRIMFMPKKPVWKKVDGCINLELPREMPEGGADEYQRVEWHHPYLNRSVIMWRLV